MTAELGVLALILALLLALLQASLPLAGAARRRASWMATADYAAVGQVIFVGIAFAALTWGFVTSDFSIANVAQNSHTAKPMLYKISGVWGNHEGSMLLWVLILALFGAAVALFGGNLPATLKARVLGVHGMVGLGFLTFVLFTSNPFERVIPPPPDGSDLNPLLQDPGLAFHPPFLYLGYVGFSMAFSFSVAALLEGRVDAAWARWVRPWVLAAWCFLTIGITLGSFWAYYELGWGGWWFWDPVENASFMPWLLGTALLHSALVVENRQTLVNWTVLLGILTFSLSLVGTFLVRSGVLTSVHAFALDPGRGVFILALILLSGGGGLMLYALRAPGLARGPTFSPVSREGALVWNNILLVSAAATVFIGTFYPLAIDLVSQDKISVGPPYYNLTFVPIILPLLALMVAGPLLRWRADTAGRVLHRTRWLALCLLAGILGIWMFSTTLLTAVGFGLAVWIVVGSLLALADRIQLGRVSWRQALGRATRLPGAVWGMCVAHLGVGICVAGITAMSTFQEEAVLLLEPGAETTVAGYTFRLDEVAPATGPNYQADQARFTVVHNGVLVTTLISERRFYPVRRSQTTEAGIWSNGLINLYVSLGERSDTGAWAVRAYYHPLAPFIWVGALVMAGGGLLSLTDRRLRVGSPQRRVATARPPTGRELPTQPS